MWKELLEVERHPEVLARGPRALLGMTGTLIAAGAVYGAVLGMWRGGPQILFAAIKLPLVLLVTCALTLVFLRITSTLLGLGLGTVEVALLTVLAMTISSLVLAALAPALWLFTLAAPPPSLKAQTAHNLLFLLHTAAVAIAGCTGTWTLRSSLRRLSGNRRKARQVLIVWIAALALVGGEVAWAFRPFVGSIYLPPSFLRQDALKGNVYEFLLTDIAPHLMGAHDEGDPE